uniref:Uncharacterized protein n=1 Tax=viral metagenome TaxID=1070528 RepID=A0A6C0K6X1_9ZZZZ
MNDNLRYISLQYIKGDNYEEIKCFKYDVLKGILENKDDFKDISIETLRQLKDALDEDNKCYIGESFLNDLVNYYNFKDIKSKIRDAKAIVENNKKELNRKDNDANKETQQKKGEKIKIAIALKELVDILARLKNDNIRAQLRIAPVISPEDTVAERATVEAAVNKYKEVKELLEEGKIQPLLKNIDDDEAKAAYAAYAADDADDNLFKNITNDITKAIINNKGKDYTDIKAEIISGINSILSNPAGTKYNLISLLSTLRKLILYENEQETLKGKSELANVDSLMALFKTYTKICDRNIGKFDRLFKQNDIIDIDEAFMIESYATFLNKLKRLKRNLESKDEKKLERALTKSLDKLFNLYGINDYEKIINGDETDKAFKGTDAQNYFKNLLEDY